MTSAATIAPPIADDLPILLEQIRVERFYTYEAQLLDEGRYEEWLALFPPDTRYFMPIRRTKMAREAEDAFTRPGEMAFFDDNFDYLSMRVRKIRTGTSWSEDPPSRQRHLITNVCVETDQDGELDVRSSFHFYRARLEADEETFIGQRVDRLRRVEDGYRIARRTIYLDQTVLLARNLSNFF